MDMITLYKIRSRILVNVDTINTTTEILENKVSITFGFSSPAAYHKPAHPDGKIANSRAAAKHGICIGLSSYATYLLEDVIAQGLDNPCAVQMCVLKDRAENISTMLLFYDWWVRANLGPEAGYKGLFFSVDVTVLGERLNEYHNEFRIPDETEYPNNLSCGAGKSNRTNYGISEPGLGDGDSLAIWLEGGASQHKSLFSYSLSNRSAFDSVPPPPPHPEDVELAIWHGIDRLIISNYGDRQLDGIPATLDALHVCAPLARGRIPITIDGVIRRGSDIFKELALGANYCFLRRIPI
ncbi:Peroxisomal [Penicillium rolfsii]|nr:Peroxisomal [Penicillium rolfsii]